MGMALHAGDLNGLGILVRIFREELCFLSSAKGPSVQLINTEGVELARGLARHSAAAIRDRKAPGEVVHRDDLVVL